MSFGKTGAPTQSQNAPTPDANNTMAGKGGAGGGGGVGTVATGSNQPAPFGVPAGLGNPTVGATPAGGGGMGKYGGTLSPQDAQMFNNIMGSVGGVANNVTNSLDDYLGQAGAQADLFGQGQRDAIGAQTNFLTGGATPSYGGGMMGKGGIGPMPPSMALPGIGGGMRPMNPGRALAPTRQVGAAMPAMRPAVGAPQPFSPTRQVGRALPGQPSTMPVAAPRLPAPARLTPLQPNFRTGGVRRV